ncbi:pectinesterase family protein [Streptosporangium sp. NBC_01756]|uniref:pectinesterase family protein n=1 Tax=Streptosporangium sp. NBC_01756 TaxID=2975950 RepID=UPI002DD9FDED|nr:pectinesterase family protein [Streptosporangium sp. NBC_01756]WSC86249.1 pectinesterase family protein [Streptosporangium sp. NBC_01756]
MRKLAGIGLLVATAIAWGGPAPAAQAADVPVAGGVYQLKVTKSGMCLDVVGGSKDNGALLQQWGCTADAWQQFTVVSAGSGTYTIRNVNSGRCLDVPDGAATSGLRLQQWGCGDGTKSNQQWRFVASGSGTYQVVSAATGLCMSDQGASTTSGAAIIQETCTANTNKQWAFNPVSSGKATVAADGSGTYRTVQAAIDAVPTGNASRVTITIAPGTYREIVRIPSNKPYVTLQGLGSSANQTVIVNNHYAGEYGTSGSATAFVDGHDFVATNLTISNDFNEDPAVSGHQAVALNLTADRARLTNVRLLGDQDTFLVNNSTRAYLSNSYVEGTVDFIFGGGTIVFDNCDIYEKRSTGGPITAASTDAAKTYGFLFYKSRISGASATGSTSLGRPWYPNAQVLYRESTLGSLINTAQPWTDMSANSWKNARFFEYKNTGAGAGTNSNRPQLADAQAPNYTPQKYLAGSDGWNPVG